MQDAVQRSAAHSSGHKATRGRATPFVVLLIVLLTIVICWLTALFYRSLEREIYAERTAYLEEITDQLVSTTDAITSAQWDFATIFSKQLQQAHCADREALAAFLVQEEGAFAQQGLELLAFDDTGNYYDCSGQEVRWQGVTARISADAPLCQVEITTLPTTTTDTDEMIFVLQLAQPVTLGATGVTLSHIAVARDMSIFSETFEVSSFQHQGESYIVNGDGTRIYRGQLRENAIGDAYNVLKTMENMNFDYGGSYAQLREAVAAGTGCSFAFSDASLTRYYVTVSPMLTNGWCLVNIVPSDVISAQMEQFMRRTLLSMGSIALVVILAVSLIIFLVAHAITAQKLMRQQVQNNLKLQEAANDAQAASRAKTVFLSHMSHDIRTPINGIMGMTDIAQRNIEQPARVADCLGKIALASRHLLGLVNDVLDMSRIESGKIQLENAPFAVGSLLDGCYSVVAGQALEKHLVLQKDFSAVTQPYLAGDELHLRQIFINILGNAIKFTPAGGTISFTARNCAVADGKAELTVVVRDSGIGMSKEFQEKIFEPFAQAEDSGRSKYQGTGLGMSIVKQLLDLMGGQIALDSAPGKGSCFTVRLCLPVEAAPAPAPGSGSTQGDLTGMHILLVEDNALNMEIAQYTLRDCGAQVTPAANGKEALDLFTQRPAGTFSVILMDIMMPVMGGLEATRAIRASGRADAAAIPIVAMTANAYAEDRRAALEAGMNEHLAKPIERAELLRVLLAVWKKEGTP